MISNKRAASFSLLEMIGIMALMAIVASVIVPLMIPKADIAAKAKETTDLQNLADGIKQHIIRHKSLPCETNWAQDIAAELGMEVGNVSTNARRSPRVFLIDPMLRIGTAANNYRLPYRQTSSGSVQPTSARVLILSTIHSPRPLPLTNGVAADTNVFNSIWDAPEGTVPSNAIWQAWLPAHGADLKIQRVNLGPLFRHVALTNYDSGANEGRFAIDGQAITNVPSAGIDTYYIVGSVLSLRDANGVWQGDQIIQHDEVFFYERDLWRGEIFDKISIKGLDLEKAAFFFTQFPGNANAKPFNDPTTQFDVTNAMILYMNAYVAWAQAGYPSSQQDTNYQAVLDAQRDLETMTGANGLIFKPSL